MDVFDQYRPYNFSATKCFIITIPINALVTRIDAKLPNMIKQIRGVYVSVRSKSATRVAGLVSLTFNEGALFPISIPAINSSYDLLNTQPVKLEENIKPNSSVIGYYRDFGSIISGHAAQIKVYLHYTV